MTTSTSTIAAIATASGRGGIGVVRVSGPDAVSIARMIVPRHLAAGQFLYTPFNDSSGAPIDHGVALFFAGPHSFTGEDVLELQGHGGPAVLQLVLERVYQCGAVPAAPGEFTQRAFLNDRIDLAQAEAVADLIESENAAAARAAVRSLSGEFSQHIEQLTEQLIGLRVYVEAALDFAEEEIDFLGSEELRTKAETLFQSFRSLQKNLRQGQLLRDGMTVVLAGAPNVGKSSLLNCLTGADTAIVTDVAGTTRDVLREQVNLGGLPLHVIDTAGLRESDDVVEQEGIRRARREIENADRILWVVDAALQKDTERSEDVMDPLAPDQLSLDQLLLDQLPLDTLPRELPLDIIVNKCDLTGRAAAIAEQGRGVTLHVSAKTGAGIGLLVQHLQQSAGFVQGTEGIYLARQRHMDALTSAMTATERALDQLRNHYAPELAAEDLRDAQRALNEITGEFTSDDLLGRIFAGFCIGK